ncbi:MAG: cation:proton antiporter [Gammaproteobacteria bacterium]|nr:cation:proton antiporter [Gammaproteobacteria bacterium]MBU1723428.1 cation:proton antiporter [Gammaproteobacteria bacterium]MBU2003779.1 cation:proton antiporter [Gammaproteobacteria bacterium]
MSEHITLVLASIIGLGLLSQIVSWWLKLPAILFLLLTGIILGPAVSGWLEPDALFGDLLFPLASLSVAVILFEGSLTLNFHQLQGIQRVVLNMLSVGMLSTWITVTLLAHYLVGFPWPLSWLFGAIMVVTGPTVIVPMLRTIRPNNRISQILRWEGILIDPIGALLAVLVFEYIVAVSGSSGDQFTHVLMTFGLTLLSGISAGIAGGWVLGSILQKHLVPEYLQNLVALTLVIGVHVLANTLSEESGLLAVTIMGIWLANTKGLDIEEILSFKEDLTILLVSALFIILAARIDFDQFAEIGLAGVLVFLGVQFIARPLKIFISTQGSSLKWQEKFLLGWIAPRGIVAAAVSAIFTLKLEQLGTLDAHLLAPLTFMLIIGTVIFQSATARLLANMLKVSEPEPHGFLIVGANPVGRAIGVALKEEGFRVLVADTSWEKVRDARMAGLDTYYGDVTSEHADRHLDLVGLGRLIAISARDENNQLSALRFRREFGKQNVFSLCPSKGLPRNETLRIANCLFGNQYHYSYLMKWLGKGAEIRKTRLTESFGYADYLQQHGDRAIPLFAKSSKGRLFVMMEKNTAKPAAGWEILALVMPGENSGRGTANAYSSSPSSA